MSETRTEYLDDKGRYLPRQYDELVAEVAAKYDLRDWLRRCREKKLAPPLQEEFEELAALLEFDQGMDKATAEEAAARHVFNRFAIF